MFVYTNVGYCAIIITSSSKFLSASILQRYEWKRATTRKMKKLEKKKHKLQRSISKKYIMNKKGECYRKIKVL